MLVSAVFIVTHNFVHEYLIIGQIQLNNSADRMLCTVLIAVTITPVAADNVEGRQVLATAFLLMGVGREVIVIIVIAKIRDLIKLILKPIAVFFFFLVNQRRIRVAQKAVLNQHNTESIGFSILVNIRQAGVSAGGIGGFKARAVRAIAKAVNVFRCSVFFRHLLIGLDLRW